MNEPLESCGNMADQFMIFFSEWKHNYKFRVFCCDCLPYSSVNIFNINFKIAVFMGELLKVYNV
jgi:hypothetical protein